MGVETNNNEFQISSSNMSADDPGIERALSILLGNRFRTDERRRIVSIDCSDFYETSNQRILLTRSLPQLAEVTRLQELTISGCKELDPCLPPEIGTLCHLATLKISEFHKLRSLPKEIGDLSCLKQLTVELCGSLSFLPVAVGKLAALEELDLSSCESLICLPAGIGGLSNLKWLDLSYCSELVSLPVVIGNLKARLEDLDLLCCYSLTSLPS